MLDSAVEKFTRKVSSYVTVAVFGSAILKYPTDVALDKEENIWMVDFGNNHAVRFKPEDGEH